MRIGSPPAELAMHPLAGRIPKILVSVPSTLLERRPDIARRRAEMQKQNALIGVANSSAARAEAHCVVVPSRSGTAPGRGHDCPIAGCSVAAVCIEATIK